MVQLLLAVIYLSFISLGLPDSLLGSAWPSMYSQFDVPVSYAGIVSMIISAGTIISSLQSDRMTKLLGAGRVTAISVAMTAAALLGFSFANAYWQLCLLAIPYGLGAGSVDAALNNYVALHYKSRHMSWLHCMWGMGATAGPYIMEYALSGGEGWYMGYRYIAIMQTVLTVILIMALPLWKKQSRADNNTADAPLKPLKFVQIIKIRGAKEIMLCFFCYCALETTAILWASSYLNIHGGMSAEAAAGAAAVFFIGITAGRAVSGFVTMKLSDAQMIRLGQAIIAVGIIAVLLSPVQIITIIGLALIGLGCAPIYPSIIHSTPDHFGAENSQAVIGVEMASAYVGSCLMPPLFGLIANHVTIALFPVYLAAALVVMVIMHELLVRKSHVKSK